MAQSAFVDTKVLGPILMLPIGADSRRIGISCGRTDATTERRSAIIVAGEPRIIGYQSFKFTWQNTAGPPVVGLPGLQLGLYVGYKWVIMTDHHDPRTWHWAFGMPESLQNSTKVEMGTKTLYIKHNADNTVTVKAGNYTESIGIEGKLDIEVFEAVKYAIICANFEWTDEIESFVRSELQGR